MMFRPLDVGLQNFSRWKRSARVRGDGKKVKLPKFEPAAIWGVTNHSSFGLFWSHGLHMMVILFPVLISWIILFAIDLALKLTLKNVYVRFLSRYGVVLNLFQLRFLSPRLNHVWERTTFKPYFWHLWFTIGYIISLLAIPLSMALLIHNLYIYLRPSIIAQEQQTLQPVLPGVNVPINEAAYYILALTIASVIHEAGHALAATSVNVKVEGIGLMVFVAIPAAFVELSTDVFNGLSAKKKLKIVCAGVWHNFILAAVSALILLSAPVIYSPFYTSVEGVLVARISNPGITGPSGLNVNDVVTSINSCRIKNKQEYRQCLLQAIASPEEGYCVTPTFIKEERYFSLDPEKCCGEDEKKNLCFESMNEEKFCFPARNLLKQFGKFICSTVNVNGSFGDTECQKYGLSQCLKPHSSDNFTKLLVVGRENKEDFLFWGYPGELYSTLTVTSYSPRFTIMPAIIVHAFDNFLRYTISFSMALGILNVIPCFYLDGQCITSAAVDLLMSDRLTIDRRNLLANTITVLGSILVTTSMLIAFSSLVLNANR